MIEETNKDLETSIGLITTTTETPIVETLPGKISDVGSVTVGSISVENVHKIGDHSVHVQDHQMVDSGVLLQDPPDVKIGETKFPHSQMGQEWG